MNLNSKYFDAIRVKPDKDRTRQTDGPRCAWQGCDKPGTHPAPRGRNHEGEYFRFCISHVREYNKSYNYFSGMNDTELKQYQESAVTGHRPTWDMGQKGKGEAGRKSRATPRNVSDPFVLLGGSTDAGGKDSKNRPVRNVERKSLTALNLDETASSKEIKIRYKQLVKRHHPDANGGDRGSEDKLREIIQAYNYLKSAGFC